MLAAARPRNPVGWLVLAVATIFSGSALAEVVGASAPARATAGRSGTSTGSPPCSCPCTLLALLLLPDGRLPSRRWRLPVACRRRCPGRPGARAGCSCVGPAAAPDSSWPAGFDVRRRTRSASCPRAGPTRSPTCRVAPAAAAPAGPRWRWPSGCVRRRVGGAHPGDVAAARDGGLRRGVVAGRAVWSPVADFLDVAAAAFLAVVLVSAVLRRRLEGVAGVVSHSFVYAVLVVLVATGYAVVVGLLSTLGAQLSPFGAGVVAAAAALAVLPLRVAAAAARRPRDVRRPGRPVRRADTAGLAGTRRSDRPKRFSPPSPDPSPSRCGCPGCASPPSARAPSTARHATGHAAQRAAGLGRHRGRVDRGRRPPGRRLGPGELTLLETLGRHAGVTIEAVRLAEAGVPPPARTRRCA